MSAYVRGGGAAREAANVAAPRGPKNAMERTVATGGRRDAKNCVHEGTIDGGATLRRRAEAPAKLPFTFFVPEMPCAVCCFACRSY